MQDCPFCEMPKENWIYEDKLCYAIVSRNPINRYHVLVIPKKHYERFIELPDATAGRIFLVAKKLSKAVGATCHPDAITHISDDEFMKGYNLVAHYKFHIIPRFKKDLHLINWGPLRVDASDSERATYARKIRKHLKQ